LENLVDYKQIGKIGHITLNRPEIDLNTIRQLIDAFTKSKNNEDICVVFTTSKKDFAYGEDLKYAYELITNPEMQSQAIEEVWSFQELTNLMREHPGIIIVGYKGWVIGGGFELTLFCDLRIAASNTKIWLPELDVGMFFSNGSTKALAWLIGASRAKEIMLLGKQLTANEALNYGIVNQVCEPDELNKVLKDLARQIALKSPLALKFAKYLINEGPENTFEENMFKEVRAMIECGKSEEAKKRIELFLKRSQSSGKNNK